MALLAWRFAGLATGFAALIGGRDRYRSRAAAVAVWSITAIESGWLLTRLARKDRWADARTARVDAAAAIAGVALTRANLAPEDRSTWVNWAPWTLGASAMAAQGMRADHSSAEALGAAALVGANAALVPRRAELIANAAGMATFFAGGRLLARQLRDGADRLERARGDAEREGARLAAERERARQLRLLHDRAVQTLEAIGSGRDGNLDSIRAHAAEEAESLQRELDGRVSVTMSLGDEIDRVVREQRNSGLHVDLDVAPAPLLAPTITAALCDACREALTNVRKHAGVARANVAVGAAPGGARVVVEDGGIGFEPATQAAFGISESIERRMRDAGGTAVITSRPRIGTRVTLWGPG